MISHGEYWCNVGVSRTGDGWSESSARKYECFEANNEPDIAHTLSKFDSRGMPT